MRNVLEMNRSTVVLARGEIASLRPRGGARRIACLAGMLWVTADGRREDSVLGPGEAVTLAGPGTIVVEALRTATMRLETAGAGETAARLVLR